MPRGLHTLAVDGASRACRLVNHVVRDGSLRTPFHGLKQPDRNQCLVTSFGVEGFTIPVMDTLKFPAWWSLIFPCVHGMLTESLLNSKPHSL